LTLWGAALADEQQEPLVLGRAGDLPILITVPHGGTEPIPGVAPRQRGVVRADGGTLDVAQALTDRLERELGARPYLVAARFHRRFADANRAEPQAIESAAARTSYAQYHARIGDFVAQLRARFPNGALLIDLHGQNEDPAVAHRGTQNGATVAALLRRHGPDALSGPQSLFGALQRTGTRVFPPAGAPLGNPRENARWAGGYTVQSYGSGRDGGIDAIQIELGRDLRRDTRIVAALATAVATFHRAYLQPAAKYAATPTHGPPKAPRHLVLARDLVENVLPDENRYVLGGSTIHFPGDAPGVRHAVKADCSGFMLALFARAGYATRSQMVFMDDGSHRKRPRAEDFLASIERERGFRRLRVVDDIRPGDLLAHAMLDSSDKQATGTTGHVFLLASEPRPINARAPVVNGTRQYAVTVIDSNDELVGDDDSRRRGSDGEHHGLGTGTIRLYADANGRLVGWGRTFANGRRFFSYDPRFPSDTRRRRAELGRVLAAE
jgi:N-formylglutamate amidohydrolase